jgi:DNA end-binding protein Ku
MAARAMWKATLNFGGESLPVKLYSAVEDRSLRFHLLEEKTEARITQKLVDPETSKERASFTRRATSCRTAQVQ